MYSWLVTVLLLASAANGSGGAQVPVTNYTCTQPNLPGLIDQCPVSGGLRRCAIKEGARLTLLSSSVDLGVYGWDSNANPFVVLDVPRGWCVGSVRMMFVHPSSIPVLSLSVHSAKRLSTNTDRTMFSLDSEACTTPVMMNLTTLARGKYLRINMTSTGRLYLRDIEVFGTNDGICTHPSSAGGDPASPTTSGTAIRTTMTGRSSLTHTPTPTSFSRDPPTHNAGSTDLGHSTGVTSAVFFAGLLAGAALAGPAGALSVVCYHWKKKQAKTRGKDDTMSEYKEPAYDCPIQLEENPAYEAMQK